MFKLAYADINFHQPTPLYSVFLRTEKLCSFKLSHFKFYVVSDSFPEQGGEIPSVQRDEHPMTEQVVHAPGPGFTMLMGEENKTSRFRTLESLKIFRLTVFDLWLLVILTYWKGCVCLAQSNTPGYKDVKCW